MDQLRIRAKLHARTPEDEAREILRATLGHELPPAANLAIALRTRFAPLGGTKLPVVPRDPMRGLPSFET